MDIIEIFIKAVNSGSVSKALKILGMDEKKIGQAITKKKFVIESKDYDIVIDYRPKINYLILYLCKNKIGKKLLKSLNQKILDFKSLVVYIGYLRLFDKTFEVRLGAYGYSSSELGNALIGRTTPKVEKAEKTKKKRKKKKSRKK